MSLHPRVLEFKLALEANGCTVQPLHEVDYDNIPDVVAHKNGVNRVMRLVPGDASLNIPISVGGFPTSDAQEQWDKWYLGGVSSFSSIQDAIALLNAAQAPEEEEEEEEEEEPPTPGFVKVQVWGMPQVNRPRYRISPTNYGLCSTQSFEDTYRQSVTYSKVSAVSTQDRLQIVKETGQNLISFRSGPKPGDLQNNGCRASIGATFETDLARYRKVSFAYQGDRTKDLFKVKFPSAGMPDVSRPTGSGYFGLFWQWHQEGSSGGSPPIEFVFRQHPTTGVYWIWARYQGISFDNAQPPQYANPGGAVGYGGVLWMETLQLDHWYQFEVEILHSLVRPGQTDPQRGPTGSLKLIVDGVTKVNNNSIQTMTDIYNHIDSGLYQGRCINGNRYLYITDWQHYVIPGPALPVTGPNQSPIVTNPLRQYYTPP